VRKTTTAQSLYFPPGKIEQLCLAELRYCGLLPDEPSPVRIDRYLEKRHDIVPDYESLPPGILGATVFEDGRPVDIYLSGALDRDHSAVAERRLRATLAHEAGHCLLHASLFTEDNASATLFADHTDPKRPKILCREDSIGTDLRGYNGRWHEYQANLAIGGFLLPTPLVLRALAPFTRCEGLLGTPSLDWTRAEDAAHELADIFNVNPVVARIRLDHLFGTTREGQQLL
jgi:Zn-dependent peptidase ImmA (M78 family)